MIGFWMGDFGGYEYSPLDDWIWSRILGDLGDVSMGKFITTCRCSSKNDFDLRKCSETSMKLDIFLQNSLRYTDVYYIYIYKYIYTYMYIYIHIYIHTHIIYIYTSPSKIDQQLSIPSVSQGFFGTCGRYVWLLRARHSFHSARCTNQAPSMVFGFKVLALGEFSIFDIKNSIFLVS